jgi:putative endopeptidase
MNYKKLLFLFMVLCHVLCFADADRDYKSGKPWIDSDLKENVVSSQRPSPKDDYHLYVNYDWLVKSEIPEGEKGINSFYQVQKTVEENILEVLTDSKLQGHDAGLVQSLYSAILDWKSRDALGIKPLQPVIDQIKNIKTIDELSDFITSPEKTFLVPKFVGVANTVKPADSLSYITEIGFDGFMLNDAAEYKNRTEVGDRYYQAGLYKSKAMLTRLGYSETEVERMFNDMLVLEAKLAKKAFSNAQLHSPDLMRRGNNTFSAKRVASLSPKFPLIRFIENNGYGDAKEFLVAAPRRLSVLNRIYKKENLELIKAYMIIRTSCNYAGLLDSQAYDVAVNADNMVIGAKGKIDDKNMAVQIVRGMLTTPLNKAYLERYDLSDLKRRITKICEDTVAIYRKMLAEEEWLSEKTKNKALEKLDGIRIHSVYPEKWIDYSGLQLKGLSLIECIKAISEYNKKLDLTHTNGKVDKTLWLNEELLIANAFYYPIENSINIIPGLMGSPFYYEGMPQEALMGGIGVIIGHEISHAFDTRGALFDKDGNFKNWWARKDFKAFKKRAAKLIAYYDNITVWDGMMSNGTLVQGEAIADMAGMKAMLRLAKTIPGFDYKMFFEAFATNWRGIYPVEFEQYLNYNDPHPKFYQRTNVTVQQFDEFYETYEIKPGDKMYLAPEERVLVW